jgi:hypothetical protein
MQVEWHDTIAHYERVMIRGIEEVAESRILGASVVP